MNKKYRIAHFSLPFYNGGGLVKYVRNIIDVQVEDENIDYICVLYPGKYNLLNKSCNIETIKDQKFDCFEINNFNPTTLLEGTRYPEKDIINNELEDVIIEKLIELKINLVHFHTFHGISSNLMSKMKLNNIKMVYTVHDYQPICNRITLLNNKKEFCDYNKGMSCNICNSNALTEKKLILRYSKISNYLKNNNKLKSIIKKVVINKNKTLKLENITCFSDNKIFSNRSKSFINNFNNNIDKIIYSSNISKNIFEELGVKTEKGILLPISNKDLNKSISNYDINLKNNEITFGYLGGDRAEKGYKIMLDVFTKLYDNQIKNWKLFIIGSGSHNIDIPKQLNNNIIIVGHKESDLYKDFEVLIVPSIWAETFNFVTVEGLINKKLIISSNIVGSADLYKESGIIIYENNNFMDLYDKISGVLSNKCKTYSINIKDTLYSEYLNFNTHYTHLINIYNEVKQKQ